jgi:uncharacterized protein (DUF697 family)/GTP-binding protein EngB required for normal cell division
MNESTPSPDAEIQAAYDRFFDNNEVPVILVCGKTGAGKSSILNALAGNQVREVGVVPTTQFSQGIELESDYMALQAIDVAGFGESGRHEERMHAIFAAREKAHLALLVIGCPDRGLEMELDFLSILRAQSPDPESAIPFLCAANKIDMAKPRSVWDPDRINLMAPSSEKERNIQAWMDYVDATLQTQVKMPLVPCAAGESWNDFSNQYGIDILRQQIFLMLPEAARTWFARMTKDKQIIDARARQIILTAAIAAGGAAFQPLPNVPDAAIIAPIQTAMIVSLAKLNGYNVTPADAFKLVGPVIGTMAGRLAFEQVMKLIPGVGSVLGATVAAAITLSLGQGYHSLMKHNIWQPEKEAVLQAFNKHWEKNKNLSFQDILNLNKQKEAF